MWHKKNLKIKKIFKNIIERMIILSNNGKLILDNKKAYMKDSYDCVKDSSCGRQDGIK